MIDCISKPTPESSLIEEFIGLTQHVHLGILVQKASRNELIENTNDQRRQKGEDDVEARHGPRFIECCSREAVIEGILQ